MSKARCSNCGESKEIVNVKFMRCVDCCQLKQFAPKVKKVYKIPSISSKERVRKKEKELAYKEKEDIEYCESCGETKYPLSRSHTVSVAQRKDLENDPENIVIECFGGSERCHDIWEHGDLKQKQKLETFNDKVQYMVKVGYIKGLQKLFGANYDNS